MFHKITIKIMKERGSIKGIQMGCVKDSCKYKGLIEISLR